MIALRVSLMLLSLAAAHCHAGFKIEVVESPVDAIELLSFTVDTAPSIVTIGSHPAQIELAEDITFRIDGEVVLRLTADTIEVHGREVQPDEYGGEIHAALSGWVTRLLAAEGRLRAELWRAQLEYQAAVLDDLRRKLRELDGGR